MKSKVNMMKPTAFRSGMGNEEIKNLKWNPDNLSKADAKFMDLKVSLC